MSTKQISPRKKEESPQSELSLVQLPLFDLRSVPVDKGSDAYQRIYRNTNETSVYIGLNSVGSGLVSDLNRRIYRLIAPSSRKV